MVSPKQKHTGGKKDELDRPWVPGDAIPVPEAVHKGADSGWALWDEISRQHEARFAETAPMPGPAGLDAHDRAWATTMPASTAPSLPAAAPRRQAQPLFTLESAMLVARRNNRVCPRPHRWTEFSALLPPRQTARGVMSPPPPITGQAWAVTPSLTKRLHFREQIEWAERAGVLDAVMAFMQALPEEEWLHMGED